MVFASIKSDLSFNLFALNELDTISWAAFPTDFIVLAEKAYGIIAPSSRVDIIKGSNILTVFI
jgi:hypothetical protein